MMSKGRRNLGSQLKKAQEIAHLGSWELDIEENKLTWSDEVYRIFGLKPQEFEATYEAFLEYVHPDDRVAVDDAYVSSLREGRDSYQIIHRVICKNSGEVRWVQEKCEHIKNLKGKIVRSVGMVLDITERKQYEEALKRARDEWAMTFDTVPDLIAIIGPDYRISQINKSMADRIHMTKDQAIGKYCYEAVHGLYKAPAFCPHTKTCCSVKECMAEVYEPKLGGYFLISTTPIYDEKKGFMGSIHVARDITDRKRFEQGLQRLSDIGALAATVAHELRNPLGVIRLAAYNIKRKDKSGIMAENIANIDKMIVDSEQIISNLLFYSRIKEPHLKEVNAGEIIKESIAQSVAKFTGWKVKVSHDYKKLKKILFVADPVQVKELFVNILNNAFESLPEKKGIIKVEGSYSKEKNNMTISILDNGIGIDPDDLSEISRPFFTRKTNGTGLGLSVCYQIVSLHGGKIEVSSQKNKGSVFAVQLPLLRQEI